MSNKLEGFSSNASSFNADMDFAFWLHVWISVALFLSVVVPMFYFAWKYRADKVKNEDIGDLTHHTGLELTWTIVPIIAVMVFFYYGNTTMQMFRTMPAESQSIVINVEGSKWKWKYEYPANASGHVHKIGGVFKKPVMDDKGQVIEEGTMGISALYVPVNTNIILKMSAPVDDVIHSYYIPAFRMKEDVVPGRTTKQWFNANKVGEYDVQCAEYCGTDHSYMYSKIVVMEKDKYEAWFNSTEETPKGNFAKTGDSLLRYHGCKSCHAIDTDATLVGPSLKTRFSKEQVLDVIKNGQDQLGYDTGAMPAGLASGKDAEEIAAYVAGGMKGQQPASFAACSSCHGEDGKGMGGMFPNIIGYDAPLIRQIFKHGKEGMIGRMPAYPDVTEEDIAIIAEYLDNNK
jgi:cytochrome c oxidase subunit 2